MTTRTISIEVNEKIINEAKKEYKGNLSQLLEELIVQYLSRKKKKEIEKEYRSYYMNLDAQEISEEKEILEEFQFSDWDTLNKIEQEEKD